MELIDVISRDLYSFFAQSTILWPFVVLSAGIYMAISKKRGAIESIVVAITLGIVLFLIFAMGQAYGLGAIAYQYAGVGLYYVILLGWIGRLLYIKKKRA